MHSPDAPRRGGNSSMTQREEQVLEAGSGGLRSTGGRLQHLACHLDSSTRGYQLFQTVSLCASSHLASGHTLSSLASTQPLTFIPPFLLASPSKSCPSSVRLPRWFQSVGLFPTGLLLHSEGRWASGGELLDVCCPPWDGPSCPLLYCLSRALAHPGFWVLGCWDTFLPSAACQSPPSSLLAWSWESLESGIILGESRTTHYFIGCT